MKKKIVKSLCAKTSSSHRVNPRDNASSRCDKVIFCLRPFYISLANLFFRCRKLPRNDKIIFSTFFCKELMLLDCRNHLGPVQNNCSGGVQFVLDGSKLKFIYFEKATRFCKISTLLLSYIVPVKSKVEISQNYTQSPLIRTTAKLPTLGVLKNSSNLDAHWFLIPQV